MPELRLSREEFSKYSLFVSTPMYGGICNGLYARSIADLSAICTHWGLQLKLHFLFNESLITRARNYCCDEFMRSGCTHMFFVDSDIGFDARDVIALMKLQIDNPKYDIIGAAYPKKTLAFEKMKAAVDRGLCDPPHGTAADMERYMGDFVFNAKPGVDRVDLREPFEVLEIGTGFMMIRRETLQKFQDHYWEQYKYRPDHVRTAAFDGSREIMQFFQAEIEPETQRYLSEDYWFSRKCQKIGLTTWLCGWMKLQHVGTQIYSGSLADLARAGASLTADPSALAGIKK